VHRAEPDLIIKIEDYFTAHNNDPKPFLWTATAADILANVACGCVPLQAVNQ
jgi:hypothetical protein